MGDTLAEGCGSCSIDDCPGRIESDTGAADAAVYEGRPIVWAAIATFLLPLMCALLAASLVGDGEVRRLMAATVGLIVGVLPARHFFGRRHLS